MAKKCKIKPLGSKVLVDQAEAEEVTKGGIVLPETAKEKPKQGTIIAVGQGKLQSDGKRSSFTVKAGDKVLFSTYAGTDIKIGGEQYLLMDESDILAIID
jgi:chaperonin GroES